MTKTPYDGAEIAIVGMACRLPGADDPESFWRNLVEGVESIRRLSDEELLAAGVDPAELRDPRYVPAASVLDGVEGFDAGFFGYNAAEAKIMDPQQRVFLECCWEALEHAGYASPSLPGPVGVYAGSKTNTYLFHLASDRALVGSMDFLQLVLGGPPQDLGEQRDDLVAAEEPVAVVVGLEVVKVGVGDRDHLAALHPGGDLLLDPEVAGQPGQRGEP